VTAVGKSANSKNLENLSSLRFASGAHRLDFCIFLRYLCCIDRTSDSCGRTKLCSLGLYELGGYLSCHSCCDTWPRIFSVSSDGPPHSVASNDIKGMWKTNSNSDSYGSRNK
jgi:hypothetical protein